MKKLVLIALGLVLCSTINAQEELHKLLHPNSVKAGSNVKTQDKDTDIPVKLLDGIFVLSQEYQLHDQKEDVYYGFEDADEFGPIYSIGFFYRNCYMMNDMGFHPWVYDRNYDEFAGDDNLVPVRDKTRYMMLTDLEDTRFSREDFKKEEPIEIKKNCAYLYTTLRSSQKGFGIDTQNGSKDGKLVWVLNSSDRKRQVTPSFRIQTYEVESTESLSVDAPEGNVIGGLFLIEDGKSYKVAGMTNKKDGRWVLEFPFVGLNLNDVNAEIEESKTDSE